jgi:hypothetical protein
MIKNGDKMEHQAVRLKFHVLQNTKEENRPAPELQVLAKVHLCSEFGSVI